MARWGCWQPIEEHDVLPLKWTHKGHRVEGYNTNFAIMEFVLYSPTYYLAHVRVYFRLSLYFTYWVIYRIF